MHVAIRLLQFSFLFFFPLCSSSQTQDSLYTYQLSVQASLSTAQTPFWQQANQFGAIPLDGTYLLGRGHFYKQYQRQKALDWSAGAELVGFMSQQSDAFLTDAFLAGKIGPLEIMLGQRRDYMGLMDTLLTSGSVAMAGNARPFPKLQLSFPDFTSLPFTNHFVAIKGNYSDGLLGGGAVQFGNVDNVPTLYLHQKSLYVRLGKPEQRWALYGGFNHQVMWGGEDQIFTGGLSPWDAYYYSVIGKSWAASRVGNHFGTIDLAAEWKGKEREFLLYVQNIYEDGSLSELTNLVDGLYGFRIKRREPLITHGFRLSTVLLEFLYTKSQGGSIFDLSAGIFGRDNYFNHYVYSQGWSYRSRTLGTPLIAPQEHFREEIARESSSYTTNNRLWALHGGLNGHWGAARFTSKATYSRNFGLYDYELRPVRNQFSFILHTEIPLPAKSYLTLSSALDVGRLYPNRLSFLVGWCKKGVL